MWLIPLTLLTAAVRTLNVPNVSSSSRDLVLADLCFLRADFLSPRLPRRFFRANTLRFLLSSGCALPRFLPSFFRRVGCSTPTTPGLLHRQHFCLLACALRAFLLSSLRVPRFPRRRCPNFATASTDAAGNDFPSLGCVTAVLYWRHGNVTFIETPLYLIPQPTRLSPLRELPAAELVDDYASTDDLLQDARGLHRDP